MGDVVNLRRVRKGKLRDDEAKAAEANRLKFGRTKAERELTDAKNLLSERALDGHRREDT
jgi:Domain of unknown function (DUF4169)